MTQILHCNYHNYQSSLKFVPIDKFLSRFSPTPLAMENSGSSPHSRGNLSPLRVSGASAHEAMQNAAPEAPVINLECSDDDSVSLNQLLRAPKLPPLPLSPDDPESSSHGDSSDDDYVPSAKSPHSATMSLKKPSSFKFPANHDAPSKSSLASPASLCSPFGRGAKMSFSEALSSLVRTHNTHAQESLLLDLGPHIPRSLLVSV